MAGGLQKKKRDVAVPTGAAPGKKKKRKTKVPAIKKGY